MAWTEKHGDGYRVRYRLGEDLITENGNLDRTAAEDRAADIESDQRRGRFVDPRLAHTTVDEWIRSWTQAHFVTATTSATYDSHIRNHVLPRWSGTALGDIQRIAVKGWVNNQLRRTLADKSCQDILVLFSMILGEAVDEGLIGTNPCRKLRITFTERPERPHATPAEVVAISARMATAAGLMVITAAYTGMRWGELAGLQWTRVHLDDPHPYITIDPDDGALHELGGRLDLGPPKSASSARTVNLPTFLVDLLTEHHDAHRRAFRVHRYPRRAAPPRQLPPAVLAASASRQPRSRLAAHPDRDALPRPAPHPRDLARNRRSCIWCNIRRIR